MDLIFAAFMAILMVVCFLLALLGGYLFLGGLIEGELVAAVVGAPMLVLFGWLTVLIYYSELWAVITS